MQTTLDSGGRVLIPQVLRESFGLIPGSTIDISASGTGIQIAPGGSEAHIVRNQYGRLVAIGTESVTDDMMYNLIDAGRK